MLREGEARRKLTEVRQIQLGASAINCEISPFWATHPATLEEVGH